MDHEISVKLKEIKISNKRGKEPRDLVDLEFDAISGKDEELSHEGDREPVSHQLRVLRHFFPLIAELEKSRDNGSR
jgi:hypothetical protein